MTDLSKVPKGPGSDWAYLKEIWRSARKRCQNPNCKDYPKYGGRGITLCKEWEDFENFYIWALSHGFKHGLTLDRINNNRGYRPDNCRWVGRKGQAYNRTTNRYLRCKDGEVHTLEEWARRLGTPPSTVARRIERGWTVDEAVRTPVGKK